MRGCRVFMTVVVAVSIWVGLTLPARAEQPTFDGATTLQIPGVLVGWPLTRGAAVYNPVVQYGHGRIYPTPAGYGYVFSWTNLSTGASGVITDDHPERGAVATGPGHVVVTATAHLRGLEDVFGTPSIGTFYVTP